MRTSWLDTLAAAAVAIALVNCGANGSGTSYETGGSRNGPSTGGTATKGGSGPGSGGGVAVTGGTGHGGATTGGSASGGTAMGGSVSGGSANGGATTGGTFAKGGTGGSANTFGGATNGSGGSTGGTFPFGNGGKANGGAASGGASMGGGGGGGFGRGGTSSGGAVGSGGSGTAGAPAALDCGNVPPLPTTGATTHTSGQGGSDNLVWQIWSNGGNTPTTLTTYGNVPAFSTSWDHSSNFLARLGFEWGSNAKTFDAYGTITAQFAEKKTGDAGGQWSYIGIYGWTNNPCIEWYIIDDSYGNMPINPGNCSNMSNSPLSVDGGQYTMCVRNTTGSGGDRCNGASSWDQYYSIRHNNRSCGTISVSEHFKAWTASGHSMGKLLEVKVLVEVGGGKGTVDFQVANVMKTQ